jgi:hypothetical protein
VRSRACRTKVLTPDTAHGTNPATVKMAGYTVVKAGTNPDGGVDLDDLSPTTRRRFMEMWSPRDGRDAPESSPSLTWLVACGAD